MFLFQLLLTFGLAQAGSGHPIWKRDSEADADAGYLYGEFGGYGGYFRSYGSFPIDYSFSSYPIISYIQPYTASYRSISNYIVPVVSHSYPAPVVSHSYPAPVVSHSHPAPGVSDIHIAPEVSHSYPAPVVSDINANPTGHIHRDVAKYLLGLDDHHSTGALTKAHVSMNVCRHVQDINPTEILKENIGFLLERLLNCAESDILGSEISDSLETSVSTHSTYRSGSGHVIEGAHDMDLDPTTFTAEDGTRFISEDGVTFTSPDGSIFTKNGGGEDEEERSGGGEHVQYDEDEGMVYVENYGGEEAAGTEERYEDE